MMEKWNPSKNFFIFRVTLYNFALELEKKKQKTFLYICLWYKDELGEAEGVQ